MNLMSHIHGPIAGGKRSSAMRALKIETDSDAPAQAFVLVLDQFASLRDYTGAPAIGGYRLVAPRREPSRLAVEMSSAIAALARARMQLTGVLSVMFVGALGLAVLAGPSSCACSIEAPSLARLGYAPILAQATQREAAAADRTLPTLSAAALIEPEETAPGVSPITTASLDPSRGLPTLRGEPVAPIAAGRLPERIEVLADRKPEPIRLAAASNIESDAIPTLPLIDVTKPRVPAAAAAKAEREVVVKHRRHEREREREHASVGKAKRSVRVKSSTPIGDPATQAPKWAQQMYTTPWQSRAFTYTQ
jgi:hypothetical protein